MIEVKRESLSEVRLKVLNLFAPPPELTVSQWADKYRRLSPEASAEQGRWNTNRAPYQRGIMDAFTDPNIHEVVVMSSAQVGKSEIILNVFGYYAHQDPSPMLGLQPTLDMAEAFSKDRIATMVRDTPVLSKIIADPKSRDSGNTLLHKKFPGGHWTLAGANSPSSLASRPIRILLGDEVDRYPVSAGTEGDPVNLTKKRTNNFFNRRIGLFSTPTIKGMSRIEEAYEHSDKRRYFVPCPECGHSQPLEWENVVYDEKDFSNAAYACSKCGVLINESHKFNMLKNGCWVATAKSKGIAGFHLNELYSPWKKWADVVEDFLKAKGKKELEKTWWNTSMGLPFEDYDGELLKDEVLASRRESWTELLLPAEVVALTAGVDTQDDRLEVVLIGWTNKESFMVVSRRVFEGSPNFKTVWLTLDNWLLNDFAVETGGNLKILASCIDSGGHNTQAVYEFCTERYGRNVWAIKGVDGSQPVWPDRVSTSRKYRGHKVWRIGVDTVKDILKARLAVNEGDRMVRFSADLSLEFFKQMTVEKRKITYDRRGRPKRTWYNPPGARNEAWDCAVYGYAAMEGMKKIKRLNLSKLQPPVPVKKEDSEKTKKRKVVKRVFGKG